MEIVKQKIKTLLSQDMVLEIDFKQKVLSNLDQLSLDQLDKILASLEKLLAKETEVVEHILKEKPYFFIEVQHEVLEIMHTEFEKEESVTRSKAEQQLEEDIANFTE